MTSSSPLPAPARVVLIGAGRVGTAAAYLLARYAGSDIVGVSSRTEASASDAADRLNASTFSLEDRALPSADVYLLGVPDDAIVPLARDLVGRLSEGAVIVHFAGSLGIGPLGDLVESGHPAAALHPVQACPSVEAAIRRIPGSAWGVTASPGLDEWINAIVVDGFKGVPVAVEEAARPLWHAASVMTSNGIAALMGLGEGLLEVAGIPPDAVVLGPLAAGTVQNASEGGGGAATLTGPIVRGEVSTVQRHLTALEDAEDLRSRYVVAARMILMSAVAGGRLAPDDAQRIETLLST